MCCAVHTSAQIYVCFSFHSHGIVALEKLTKTAQAEITTMKNFIFFEFQTRNDFFSDIANFEQKISVTKKGFLVASDNGVGMRNEFLIRFLAGIFWVTIWLMCSFLQNPVL